MICGSLHGAYFRKVKEIYDTLKATDDLDAYRIGVSIVKNCVNSFLFDGQRGDRSLNLPIIEIDVKGLESKYEKIKIDNKLNDILPEGLNSIYNILYELGDMAYRNREPAYKYVDAYSLELEKMPPQILPEESHLAKTYDHGESVIEPMSEEDLERNFFGPLCGN